MSGAFSFSFSGDDIEPDYEEPSPNVAQPDSGCQAKRPTTAFPVTGKPCLHPIKHDLEELLASLPSKISYSSLEIVLDDGSKMIIPRRELWDVRLQLMAEDDEVGLGKDDVKTGIYEGGFKSWESSVDLVKELAKASAAMKTGRNRRVLEMGCGTALPSLALYQWHLSRDNVASELHVSLADYNPSVLRLVTLPNLVLSWAQVEAGDSWEAEGDLYIDSALLTKFKETLKQRRVALNFLSGAWGPEFVRQIKQSSQPVDSSLLVLAAETIYSPAALQSFTETMMDILDHETPSAALALVAAKKVYFGVGGSVEDFCNAVRARGGQVEQIREESDGVRRAVIEIRNGESLKR